MNKVPLLLILIQIAFAQVINLGSPPSSGTGFTFADNTLTINNSSFNGTITGYGGDRGIVIAANATVRIQNLIMMTADTTIPIQVNPGVTATLLFSGENIINASIGAAAIRVPKITTETATETATLILDAFGDGKNVLQVQGGQRRGLDHIGAGAGIGGGKSVGTAVNSNSADHCGTVVIEGGVIFAYGGASGDNNNMPGGFAAGIGGNGAPQNNEEKTAPGNACDLTINGGTVTAVSGCNSYGIGAGCQNGGTNYGDAGTTIINGGSVVSRGTVAHGIQDYTGPDQKILQVGSTNETADRRVVGCQLGGSGCGAGHLKDVRTDLNGKLYFWLSGSAALGDYIILDIDGVQKRYDYDVDENFFQGPPPSMIIPAAAVNSLVGSDNAPGPYITDFRMQLSSHVAAVGHIVTLQMGEYVPNDAGPAGTHDIQWWRANSLDDEGRPVGNEEITGSTTLTYTPGANDYGKYIWAEIMVQSSDGRSSAAPVVYPPIQVGVVVVVNVTPGSGIDPDIAVTTTLTQRGLANDKNLFFLGSPISVGATPISDVSIEVYRYTWIFGTQDPVVGHRISLTLPESGISTDIPLNATVANGTVPVLQTIEICKNYNNDNPNCNNPEITVSANEPIDTKIPTKGVIKLSFRADRDIIECGTGLELCKVSLSTMELEGQRQSNNVLIYQYEVASGSYSLNIESIRNNFGNIMSHNSISVETAQPARISNIKYNISGDIEEFIAGLNIEGIFTYNKGDAGNLEELCYYWEVADTQLPNVFNDGAPGKICSNNESTNTTDPYKLEKGNFGKWVRLVARSKHVASTAPELGIADFGEWKRIGALLKPDNTGNPVASPCNNQSVNDCPRYSNVTIRGCDIQAGDIEGTPGCTEHGLMVYDESPSRLDVFLYDVRSGTEMLYHKLGGSSGGWRDDDGNNCSDASNDIFECTVQHNRYHVKPNLTSKEPLIFTITPQVVPLTPPAITEATLTRIDMHGNSNCGAIECDLVKEPFDMDNVQVFGNKLEITFDEPINIANGSVTFVRGAQRIVYSGTQLETIGNTGISVSLDSAINLLSDPFNANLSVVISGIRGPFGDQMETTTLNFNTAEKPTATTINIETTDEKYLVNKEIKKKDGTYIRNGGKEGGTLRYCWQSVVNTSGANINACNTLTENTEFQTTALGNYLRLIAVPVDKDGNEEGTRVASEWQRIGVVLKANINSDGAEGDLAIRIGSDEAKAEGVVIFGATPILMTTSSALDAFVEWTGGDGTFADKASASTTFTPVVPATGTEITITGTMKDGTFPDLWVSHTEGQGFELVFSKDIEPYNTGKKITITQSSGCSGTSCQKWEYTINGEEEFEDDKRTLILTYEDFAFLLGESRYTVSIEAGAFKDEKNNFTRENQQLIVFSRSGDAYAALRLSRRNIPFTMYYGDPVTTGTAEVTNSSSMPATVKASLKYGTEFELKSLNSFSDVNPTDSSPFTVSPKPGINAGNYRDSLKIEVCAGVLCVQDGIELNLIVKPRLIEITTLAQFASSNPSKIYDGNSNAPPINEEWNDNWANNVDNIICDNVKVIAQPGFYIDANVGNNKSLSIKYIIEEKDNAENYTFTENFVIHEYYDETFTGNITALDITAKFLETDLGSKIYDGSNILDRSTDPLYEFIGKVENDDVYLDFDNAIFSLNNPNVGSREINFISGLILGGETAGNYKLINLESLGNLKGAITPASLEGLNYTVTAEATYGDILSRFLSWEKAPESESVVDGNGLLVSGSWRICTEDIPEVCKGKVPQKGWVTVGMRCEEDGDIPEESIYAYFDASRSGNYYSDLALPVKFDAIHKRFITIGADLSEAGDLKNGTKTYDKNTELTGNVKPSSELSLGLVSGDVFDEGSIVFEFAEFNDYNVGTNKPLTIQWAINDLRYTAGETNTLGTIAARKTTLGGIEIENKYYDGEREAEATISSLTLSNIIESDNVDVEQKAMPSFAFINPGAGIDREVSIDGGTKDFALTGNDAHNYELVLPRLAADIFPGKPKQFSSDIVRAEYGQYLSELESQLSSAMPVLLSEIFEEVYDTREGKWSWEINSNPTETRVGNVGEIVVHASFMHPNPNWQTLSNVPVPVKISKKQLTAFVSAESKVYNGKADDLSLTVEAGGVVLPEDAGKVRLVATGRAENANAGLEKPVVNIEFSWGNVEEQVKNNYILPMVAENQVSVNIEKAVWPNETEPVPNPREFIYDLEKYPNLAAVSLSAGWSWVHGSEAPANPHNKEINPNNESFITIKYVTVFQPPEAEAINYIGKLDSAELIIHKRSEDSRLDAAHIVSSCGSSNLRLTVIAKDSVATIWHNGDTSIDTDLPPGWTNQWTFTVNNLQYGWNEINYDIQAQAYGDDYRTTYTRGHVRLLPFNSLISVIRDKTLSVDFGDPEKWDSDFRNFFNRYAFNLNETEWYKGDVLMGRGRHLALEENEDRSEYFLILVANNGERFISCREDLDFPPEGMVFAKTPLPKAQPFYGARLALGGTSLTLNTPQGGKINIYTSKGELVSTANITQAQTKITLPNTKGIYIIKLEAK
ncbi:MAG: YDG domain-containing protein [Fibromonadaceae bacterium]|jgi:hypothetical protein|nr:YDG domain-containing protein [Fibromonadaceae bacterium]